MAQTADDFVYRAELSGFDPNLGGNGVVAPRQVRGLVTIDVPDGPVLVDFTDPLGDPLATFQIP